MKKGELDNAVRRALNRFDVWNQVTGFIVEHTGYYYELQSIIEDAVHCGVQAATGDYRQLEDEKTFTIPLNNMTESTWHGRSKPEQYKLSPLQNFLHIFRHQYNFWFDEHGMWRYCEKENCKIEMWDGE